MPLLSCMHWKKAQKQYEGDLLCSC
jgi:hypothetical protein